MNCLVDRLRARAEALEAVISERMPLSVQLGDALGLERVLAETLELLMRRETVTRSGLVERLYGGEPDCDQPEDAKKNLDVIMAKLRPVLRRHGIGFDAVWGVGFKMSRADKAKLKALLDI